MRQARERMFVIVAAATVFGACLSDPGLESAHSAIFPCVRNGENYCAICAPQATDSADELATGCADALRRPGQQAAVTERMGNLHITLSGQAHLGGLLGDQAIPETPMDFRARVFSQGSNIGVQLTAGLQNGQEYQLTGDPRMEPVAANANGDYVGDMTVPIDFGALGNNQLAAQNNVRNAAVHIRFRLQGGDLGAANGGSGQVESLHVEDVRLAMGGGRIGIRIDMSGPVTMTLDALQQQQPADPRGTPEWKACLQQIITRDCCVGEQVFGDVVRIGGLPAGLSAPADCSAGDDEDEPEQQQPGGGQQQQPGGGQQQQPAGGAGHEAAQPTALGAPPIARDDSLQAGVANWYSVQIGAAGRYSFETTTGSRNDNSATDTKIDVYAGNGVGAALGSDDDGSADGAGSRLELALPAGLVLVKVSGYNQGTTGPYTLAIGPVAGAQDPVVPPDEEPDEEEEPPANDEPDGQDAPVMQPPDEGVQGQAGYSVAGARLFCDGNDADDAACWNNVNRQVIGGGGLRNKALRSISWEMDTAARLSETLEIEVYLIHGVGPRPGQVVESTRQRIDVMDGLRNGACVERGQVITCTATYAQRPRLPATGNVGDDWFILEMVGRDGGEIAPDGTPACGRYPARVAGNLYNDPTVNLGGYLQLHDWAGPSCEFSYSTVARKADMDLAARVTVE